MKLFKMPVITITAIANFAISISTASSLTGLVDGLPSDLFVRHAIAIDGFKTEILQRITIFKSDIENINPINNVEFDHKHFTNDKIVNPVANNDWITYSHLDINALIDKGNKAKEWVVTFGMTTSQGQEAVSDHADKVLNYRGVQALPGAGNTWVDNDVLDFNGVNEKSIMVGTEIDYNNASQTRYAVPQGDAGASFGFLITGTGLFQGGAAYAVEGRLSSTSQQTNASTAWDAAYASLGGARRVLLDAGDSDSTIQTAGGAHNIGVNFGETAFGQAAIRLRGGGNAAPAFGSRAGHVPFGGGAIEWVSPSNGKSELATIGADGQGALHLSSNQLIVYGSLLPFSNTVSLGNFDKPFSAVSSENLAVQSSSTLGMKGGTTTVENDLIANKNLLVKGNIKLPAYKYGNLPNCDAMAIDMVVVLIDAIHPLYNRPVKGGGAQRVPVYCDGKKWTAH